MSTSDSRTKSLEAAVLDGEISVGSLKLRSFSLGTLTLCRQLNLTLFTESLDGGDKKQEALSNEETQRQLAVFAWMQSAPLKQVREAVKNDNWKADVEEFEFSMDVALLPQLTQEIERISKLAAAAAVEVVKKSGGGDPDKGAPPNS